jgi:outer membrane protein OmpA-like peptidoglycan-associated protein
MDEAVLTRATTNGEYWYIYRQSSGNDQSTSGYTLTTVQPGGPVRKSCTLRVHGVNFDADKAVLRPESEPVLTELLKLFTSDTRYAAEIGGHTDNVGQRDYNLRLSGQRAAAVKAWLVAHGVADSRVTSAGYGDTRPLVPNTLGRKPLPQPACRTEPRRLQAVAAMPARLPHCAACGTPDEASRVCRDEMSGAGEGGSWPLQREHAS